MSDTAAMSKAQRDDPSVTVAELMASYEAGIEELHAAVAGMTAEQLVSWPIPGKWSTLEVVCHIADCEQFFADRIKRTLATDRPLLIGVESAGYSGPLGYQQHELQEELDLVRATRTQLARSLRLLPPEAWQRTAVHSETGLVTVRQLLLHAVNHLRHHVRFIDEKRAAQCDHLAPAR